RDAAVAAAVAPISGPLATYDFRDDGDAVGATTATAAAGTDGGTVRSGVNGDGLRGHTSGEEPTAGGACANLSPTCQREAAHGSRDNFPPPAPRRPQHPQPPWEPPPRISTE
ncbi:hypothetical protein Vafri_15651, partial [Volvox africanus]